MQIIEWEEEGSIWAMYYKRFYLSRVVKNVVFGPSLNRNAIQEVLFQMHCFFIKIEAGNSILTES